MEKKLYEVKAYGKHGVYAEVVEAADSEAALKVAKPLLKKRVFGSKVIEYVASRY